MRVSLPGLSVAALPDRQQVAAALPSRQQAAAAPPLARLWMMAQGARKGINRALANFRALRA